MEPKAAFHKRTWILVANGSRAKVYSHDLGDEDVNLVREFDFPEGRAKGSDLVSDRPGAMQSQGSGHGTRRPATDPKDNAHEHFAREVVHHLEAGYGHQHFGHLIVVASLPFLGTLLKQLPDNLGAVLRAKIEKDLTLAPVSELRALVLPLLRNRPVAA